MQDIVYNDKKYVFFDTGEHSFIRTLKYPIKQYDGYSIVSIVINSDNTIINISYINNKPVILETGFLNKNYNVPGEVFIPIDPAETLYDVNTHILKTNPYSGLSYYTPNELLRINNNYKFFYFDNDNSIYYCNNTPVIISGFNDGIKPGVSLEENVQLKLRRYTI